MKTFVWDQKYVTGLSTVDAQHLKLVELINAFAEALTDQSELDRQHVDSTFMALAVYARDHFADEEELMHSAGLDPRFLEEHRRQHRGFIANVTEMHQSLRDGLQPGDTLGHGLMNFLVNWLASHILRTDHRMARQMAAVAEGVVAAEAYGREGEVAPESAALLSAALHELLRALGQRNRELAEANGTLEQRVSERTLELVTKNAELLTTVREVRAIQEKLIEAAKHSAIGQLAAGFAQEISRALADVGPSVETIAEANDRLRALVQLYMRAEPLLQDAAAASQLALERQRTDLLGIDRGLPIAVKKAHDGLARAKAAVRDLEALARVETDAGADAD